MKTVLVGSTGFVGGNLARAFEFDVLVHRTNVGTLRGSSAELLVCAGLPAAKWLANENPEQDFANMSMLAGILDTMTVARFVLISTIDAYQPPVLVDENDRPSLDGPQAYGRNRAWFERFITARFSSNLILRLPGLYGPALQKNLVFDLLEGRADQYANVNANSRFQFWDVTETWGLIERTTEIGIDELNVATEPVSAGDVAEVFAVDLSQDGPVSTYDMRTRHGSDFAQPGSVYLRSAEQQIAGIGRLRDAWTRT